jgi:hypothetical protein
MQPNQDFQHSELKVVPLPVPPSHFPAPPNSTAPAVLPALDRTETTPPTAPYTAIFLARENNIADVTLRTRWYRQLCEVAPESALKANRGYTDLARQLFRSYAETVASGNLSVHAWIAQEKQNHTHEWAQAEAEIISAELVPDEATVSLSTLRTSNQQLQQQMETQMAKLQQFAQSVDDLQTEFSAQDLERFQMNGALRGMKRFEVETQAELQTYHSLRTQTAQPNP